MNQSKGSRETTLERIERKIIGLSNDVKNKEQSTDELSRQLKNQEQLLEVIKQLKERIVQLEIFQENALTQSGVFISYSHVDGALVDEIVSRFQSDGINYWKDDKDLFAGQVIDAAISEGIQKNWLFLIVLTPSSVSSKWVKREFDEASYEEIEGRKIIIPIIGNGLKLNNLPPRIRRKLCIDVNSDFDTAYANLKKSVFFHLSEFQKQLDKFSDSSR